MKFIFLQDIFIADEINDKSLELLAKIKSLKTINVSLTDTLLIFFKSGGVTMVQFLGTILNSTSPREVAARPTDLLETTNNGIKKI